MARRSRWRVAALLVVGAASLAAGAFFGLRGPRIATGSPVRGEVTETVVSSGRVLPPAEINLGTLVASTVREVHVKEGDLVRTGQLLVQLEDRELVAAVEQAEAALAQAQAGRFELAKISEPAARSALTKAEATLADSKRNLQRAKELYESEVGTRSAYDDAQTAYAVVARDLEPGDSVVVGSKLLLLARTGATRLVIEPDERNLARLAVGQRATASAEAFPNERFGATVQYLAPSVDPSRGTIEVHLAVPEPPAYLRPHMTVSVEVVLGTRENTLLVPREAVRGLATDAPFVLTVEAGRVVSVPVRVGIRGDDRVEILEGLADDASLVVDEAASVEPGARVRTAPAGD
jgi:HlyD family secretion protein